MGGVFACSTAVVLIKAGHESPIRLAAERLLIAAAALTPVMLRDWRRHRGAWRMVDVWRSVWPGFFLAAHFVTWIIGARLTPAANSSLMVNLNPVVMPFVMYAVGRERLTRGEGVGSLLAVAGAALLALHDFHISREHAAGDALCLLSMLFLTGYFALGRFNRAAPSLWLYVVPLYYIAGFLCLPFGFLETRPPWTDPAREWALIVALALIPTVIGHSSIMLALRHLRAQVVSILNLSQFVFAGVMGYFLFDEIPRGGFYLACALLVAGSVIAIRATPEEETQKGNLKPET